jgi:hypothetical protein
LPSMWYCPEKSVVSQALPSMWYCPEKSIVSQALPSMCKYILSKSDKKEKVINKWGWVNIYSGTCLNRTPLGHGIYLCVRNRQVF